MTLAILMAQILIYYQPNTSIFDEKGKQIRLIQYDLANGNTSLA